MSETFSNVEVMNGAARRRPFTTEQKLSAVNETLQPGTSISYAARSHGLSPPGLPMETGKAVRVGEDVVAASEVRRLEERVRKLECLLGRKTMEIDILKEALNLARVKKRPRCRGRSFRRIPRERGSKKSSGSPVPI
jgi:transposase